LDAVRVDPNVYQASDLVVPRRSWASVTPALPVYPLMLDLPLITGGEVPQAPHACATAQPWPGPVALWHSATQDDFRYNISLDRAATIGLTQTPLARARFGLWDRGPALRLRIETGTLSSTTPEAVLGGANLAAIGDGSAQNWELFQFASATLVGPKTYDISLRLRGQLGSDALMPAVWPAGSTFVLLDAALQQIDLPLSARGLARSYRFVAADRGYDDLSAVGLTQAFDGIGLRPYAVVHLRAAKTADALGLSWVRRSRIDGDSWQSVEVPLGEDNEAYLLRVIQAGVVKREVTLSTPAFLYTAQMQASDGVAGAVSISVAQLSNLYGAGPARSLSVML
ncbi:MAG: host specificity protein, partial [Cypionkella sp.]|nr:host specificity protein [Cypionkella sp.]